MKRLKVLGLVMVVCIGGSVHGAPWPLEEAPKNEESSSEVSIPTNMNVADYYYSLFGKHLDYDYREPLITFGEAQTNDLDSIESEVDKNSDDLLWTSTNKNSHRREKRFIIPVPVSPAVYNSTRRYFQEARRLRMERRRSRMERRRQWRQQRINTLNQRAENLRRQAELLSQRQMQQLAQSLQAVGTVTRTRSVPAASPSAQRTENTFRIALPVTSTSKPSSTSPASSSPPAPPPSPDNNVIPSSSNSIPVKQVPIPE